MTRNATTFLLLVSCVQRASKFEGQINHLRELYTLISVITNNIFSEINNRTR